LNSFPWEHSTPHSLWGTAGEPSGAWVGGGIGVTMAKKRPASSGRCEHGNWSFNCQECGTDRGPSPPKCSLHDRRRCGPCSFGKCEHGSFSHRCRRCGTGHCVHGKRRGKRCPDCDRGPCGHGVMRHECAVCKISLRSTRGTQLRIQARASSSSERTDANTSAPGPGEEATSAASSASGAEPPKYDGYAGASREGTPGPPTTAFMISVMPRSPTHASRVAL
jgi:hypothetical protein